jgi:hypothetical protein
LKIMVVVKITVTTQAPTRESVSVLLPSLFLMQIDFIVIACRDILEVDSLVHPSTNVRTTRMVAKNFAITPDLEILNAFVKTQMHTL